jgi:hypothetical protein
MVLSNRATSLPLYLSASLPLYLILIILLMVKIWSVLDYIMLYPIQPVVPECVEFIAGAVRLLSVSLATE